MEGGAHNGLDLKMEEGTQWGGVLNGGGHPKSDGGPQCRGGAIMGQTPKLGGGSPNEGSFNWGCGGGCLKVGVSQIWGGEGNHQRGSPNGGGRVPKPPPSTSIWGLPISPCPAYWDPLSFWGGGEGVVVRGGPHKGADPKIGGGSPNEGSSNCGCGGGS